MRALPSHITSAPHCRRELQGNHRNLISQIVVLIPSFFLDNAKRAYYFCRKRVKLKFLWKPASKLSEAGILCPAGKAVAALEPIQPLLLRAPACTQPWAHPSSCQPGRPSPPSRLLAITVLHISVYSWPRLAGLGVKGNPHCMFSMNLSGFQNSKNSESCRTESPLVIIPHILGTQLHIWSLYYNK